MPKRFRSRSRTAVKRPRRVGPKLMRTMRRNVARSRITRTNTHMFTRWALPIQYNSVAGTGGINFDSHMLYEAQGVLVSNAQVGSIRELPFSSQFSIDQIVNFAEFNNLYDQYKINGVRFTIKMINSPDASNRLTSASSNGFQNFYPTLWYVRDYDDNSLLALSDIRQYKSARHVTLRPNKEISIYIKPRVAKQIFQSTTSTGYEIALPKFMDLATSTIPHFGLKAVIDFEGMSLPLGSTDGQWRFRINTKYYFACKNIR